jgi:hypothetical protein
MSWDGFLPPSPCRKCGKMLQGKGSGYPAETYAGCATGLCYTCTGAGAYEENYSLVSGAIVWNFPPSCPSHRRSRETYFSFGDCKKCFKGTVNKSNGIWGSYPAQCPTCSGRHRSHPIVKSIHLRSSAENAKSALVFAVANRTWWGRLEAAGIPLVAGEEWTPEQGSLADGVLADLARVLERLRNLDPIPWPTGYAPTGREVRKIRDIYVSEIPDSVLDAILPMPTLEKKRRTKV